MLTVQQLIDQLKTLPANDMVTATDVCMPQGFTYNVIGLKGGCLLLEDSDNLGIQLAEDIDWFDLL